MLRLTVSAHGFIYPLSSAKSSGCLYREKGDTARHQRYLGYESPSYVETMVRRSGTMSMRKETGSFSLKSNSKTIRSMHE